MSPAAILPIVAILIIRQSRQTSLDCPREPSLCFLADLCQRVADGDSLDKGDSDFGE